MTEENNVQQPTAPDATQESGDLSISDLNAMKMIIDVASQRGAFKPNDMVVVGQTYNKLSAFLSNVSKQPAQQGA